MKKMGVLLCLFAFAQSIFAAASSTLEAHAEEILASYYQQTPYPQLSKLNAKLSIQDAYQVQKYFVTKQLKEDYIIGYKAGLTSQSSQKKFNTSQPVAGVLLFSSDYSSANTISSQEFQTLMIETEFGFRTRQAIKKPIEDIETLKAHFIEILPVIELPDLGFADLGSVNAIDIIATNVAAAGILFGEGMSVTGIDPNTIEVALTKDETLLYQGVGKEALNDQWQALLWLVNDVLAKGWTIEPDQVFITGSIGKMVPAQPGRYRADFGVLGQMRFSIQ